MDERLPLQYLFNAVLQLPVDRVGKPKDCRTMPCPSDQSWSRLHAFHNFSKLGITLAGLHVLNGVMRPKGTMFLPYLTSKISIYCGINYKGIVSLPPLLLLLPLILRYIHLSWRHWRLKITFEELVP